MLGSNVCSDTTFRTRARAMSRVATLCGMFGILFFCMACTCIPAFCPPATTCTTNADCATGLVCRVATETAASACVQCLTDANCNAPTGVCSEAGGNVCVSCLTDAHCNDTNGCTTDACVSAACTNTIVADGTVCGGASGCTTGACAAGACNETPVADGTVCNDNDVCTAGEVCAAGACTGTAVPGCCETNADCTAPDTCENNTCVSAGPRVTIAGCPTTASQGGTVNLTSTTAGFTAGGTLVIAWTSAGATFVPADAANTAATINASGDVVLTVTATNTIDGGDNGTPADPLDDPADTVETDTDTCTVTVAFTAQLQVDAGGLNPGRSSSSFYESDSPGTPGNNALHGVANQQGVPADAIATLWTVTSQPAGSGVVTFSNASSLDTAFRVGPPASAGAYVFTLTATNENTSETESDTVTLNLLAEPELRVADEQSPMRIVMLRGTTTPVDVDLLYTSASDAFIEVFDGNGDDPANIVTALSVLAGADAAATAGIIATDDRETDAPDAYFLTGRITDIVDAGPVDDLENPNPTPDRESLNELFLMTTDSWVETDNGLTPPVIDISNEVGEVDGGGDIVHQGIGSDNAGLDMSDNHNNSEPVKVADINEDGLGDLVVNDGDIFVYFGAPDIVTDGFDADGGNEGWHDDPDLTIDGTDDFEDYCVGDVNGDGHLDFVTVTDTGANFVEVWLLDGADSVDLGNADASRTYTADDDANVANNAHVLCGDVGTGTGASGVADIVAIADSYDDNAAAAAFDDGAVFVIYGRESLPASADIETDGVSGLTGSNQNGERIFDTASGAFPAVNDGDLFGNVATLGQWDSGGLDLVVGEGDGTGEVRIYLGGGSRISRNPSRVYTGATAFTLADGDVTLGDVTGDDAAELIVGSADEETVFIVPNGLANTGLNDSQVFNYTLDSFPLPVFDGGTCTSDFDDSHDSVAVGDLDGDGVNELLISNQGCFRVVAVKGPISSNIENANDIFRIYEDVDNDASYGVALLLGDVTGDGLDDFMMGDNGSNLVILQGFFETTGP